MKTLRFLLALLALLALGCLKRNNPLDPAGNSNITAPELVSGVNCTPSNTGAANKYVTITWIENSNQTTDGYYIYRSLSYNSTYARVGTVETNTGSFVHNTDIRPGQYWYKVSGYKRWIDNGSDSGILEGRLSSARPVTVN